MEDLEVILSAIPEGHRLYSRIHRLSSLRHGFYRYLKVGDDEVRFLYRFLWMAYRRRLSVAFNFGVEPLVMSDYDRDLLYLLRRLRRVRRGRPKEPKRFVERIVSKYSRQSRRMSAWHDTGYYGKEVVIDKAECKGLFDYMLEVYEYYGTKGLKESFSEWDVEEFLEYIGVENED